MGVPRLKTFLLIIPLIALILLLVYFFFYPKYFLSFKKISSVNFDTQSAFKLLQNPQTITFTRDKALYLADLENHELLLVSDLESISKRTASLRISQSRNYITWDSDYGLLGLNIKKRQIFQISKGAPRQSFDLSSLQDKILFLTKDELLEVYLSNGRINNRLSLPKLKDPKANFNHTKYAPNNGLAYIRSIHEWTEEKNEDALVNFQTKKIEFLKDFSNPVSLAPAWSKDSRELLAWRDGLVAYNLENGQVKSLVKKAAFRNLGAYAFNPQEEIIVYLTDKEMLAEKLYLSNREIFLLTLPDQIQALVSTNELKQKEEFAAGVIAAISDLGWLDKDQIWLTFDYGNKKDLWTISKDGSNLKKRLTSIGQHSLDSVYTSITKTYTLFK